MTIVCLWVSEEGEDFGNMCYTNLACSAQCAILPATTDFAFAQSHLMSCPHTVLNGYEWPREQSPTEPMLLQCHSRMNCSYGETSAYDALC